VRKLERAKVFSRNARRSRISRDDVEETFLSNAWWARALSLGLREGQRHRRHHHDVRDTGVRRRMIAPAPCERRRDPTTRCCAARSTRRRLASPIPWSSIRARRDDGIRRTSCPSWRRAPPRVHARSGRSDRRHASGRTRPDRSRLFESQECHAGSHLPPNLSVCHGGSAIG